MERRMIYGELRHAGYPAHQAWRAAGLEVELRALEDAGTVRITLEPDADYLEPDYPPRELRAYRDAIAAGVLEVWTVILETRETCPSCGERLAAGWRVVGAIGSVDVYARDRGTPADYVREVARELLEEHRDALEVAPCGS